MANPYIKFRNLDDKGDWCFGNNLQDYADEQQSTMLNIRTRLLSFKYDCFFDLEQGIDWMNLLGQRGSYLEDTIELNVRILILQSLYVTEIVNLDVNVDTTTRALSIEYTVNTIFGEGLTDNIDIGGTIYG